MHPNRSFPASPRTARVGFTLIEMLVVVVIAGILISISAGAIGKQIARDRVLRSANVVQGMLTEASQLAVRRRTPVRVAVSGTSLQITDEATSTTLRQRNFGPAYDLRATLTAAPTAGVLIYPDGRADAALTVTVSGSGLTTVVSRTATGIVRRQ